MQHDEVMWQQYSLLLFNVYHCLMHFISHIILKKKKTVVGADCLMNIINAQVLRYYSIPNFFF